MFRSLNLLNNNLFNFFLFFLFLLCVYVKTFNFPFIWDDIEMIVNNSFIQDVGNVKHIFTHSAFGEPFSTQKFYRPVQILSYFINYTLTGLNPIYFRLFNVFCFSCIGGLIFLISRLFSFSKIHSFFISLIFIIHPIHVEIITYVSGRGDILYILFCLLAFYFFMISNRTLNNFIVVFFVILAFFTKENSVIFPLILVLYNFLFNQKKFDIVTSILFLLSIIYSSFRVFSLKSSTALSWINHASFYEKLATLPYVFVEYFKLFIFPYPLHMEYHNVESSFLNIYLFVFILVLFILFYVRRFSDDKKLFDFGILWFFTCLIPFMHIFVSLSSTVRQHWASFAILGLLFSMFSLFKNKQIKFFNTGVVLFIVILVAITNHRNSFWSNAEMLYKNDLKYAPQSFVLWNNLGYEKFKKKDFDLAEKFFLKSIYSSPNYLYDVALNNLGVITEMKGDFQLAKYYYKKSILSGDYVLAKKNLKRLENTYQE